MCNGINVHTCKHTHTHTHTQEMFSGIYPRGAKGVKQLKGIGAEYSVHSTPGLGAFSP